VDELVEFAESQYWLYGHEEGSKISRIDNLQQVEKSLGRKPQELQNLPELRLEMSYIWAAFLDLNDSDSGKISYLELKEYAEIHGELSPFEINAIRRLSAVNKG